MIVFRYLSREVLTTLAAVSGVLLLIIMSGRFIKYLAQAAAGQLDPGVLFTIMAYRLPGFVVLILPLGMFLGILLAYGRMYLDSEMAVLSATGISDRRILGYTQGPALLVALLKGGFVGGIVCNLRCDCLILKLNHKDTVLTGKRLAPLAILQPENPAHSLGVESRRGQIV